MTATTSGATITPLSVTPTLTLPAGQQFGTTVFTVAAPTATTATPIVFTVVPTAEEIANAGGQLGSIGVVNTSTGASVPCGVVGTELQCTASGPGQFSTVLGITAQRPAPPNTGVGPGPARAIAPARPVAAVAAVAAQNASVSAAPNLPNAGTGGILGAQPGGNSTLPWLPLMALAALVAGVAGYRRQRES